MVKRNSQALVVIGIGGSYLGARGVIDCLCSPNYNLKKKNTPNVYFIGNGLSADALQEVLDLVADVDFSVNVISKSGTTTEPAVAFRFFREALEKKYGHEEAGKRIYATTDKARGALKSLADAQGWETFVVPDEVGGRYSVLTAVGLLPIAVAGVDIEALMRGAAEMMDVCANPSYDCPAWRYAAIRYELYRAGRSIELLACYDPAFRFMLEWWKQLYGESEGKEGKGLFPASVEFTADLHSMGQYIQEGKRLRAPGLRPPGRDRRRRPELPGQRVHGLHPRPRHGGHPPGPHRGRRAQRHRGGRRQDSRGPGPAHLLLRVCLRPFRLSAGRQSL